MLESKSTKMAAPTLSLRTIPLLRPRFNLIVRLFIHAFVVALCVLAAFFAHEMGHVAATLLLGGRVLNINVLGAQWYPRFVWMPQLGFGGYVVWLLRPDNLIPRVVLLSGSTGTLLIAVAAAVSLNLIRVQGVRRTALVVISLYFADSVIHIIPVLGVTYYWAPLSVRGFSEAYFALADLGVPGSVYIAFVGIISLLIVTLMIRALTRRT
jgi:hypothetical protein